MVVDTRFVDTRQVTGRRPLQFERISELRHDVEQLLNASQVHTLGNWNLPQILDHLNRAALVAFGEIEAKPPWWLKLVGPALKSSLLAKPMKPGFQLPRNLEVALGYPQDGDVQAAGRAYQQSLERIDRGDVLSQHPFLGSMTPEDWSRLQLRHAELHLSFVVPSEAS